MSRIKLAYGETGTLTMIVKPNDLKDISERIYNGLVIEEVEWIDIGEKSNMLFMPEADGAIIERRGHDKSPATKD